MLGQDLDPQIEIKHTCALTRGKLEEWEPTVHWVTGGDKGFQVIFFLF